ncbi:hypothetical protein [Thalassotalea fusca]
MKRSETEPTITVPYLMALLGYVKYSQEQEKTVAEYIKVKGNLTHKMEVLISTAFLITAYGSQ